MVIVEQTIRMLKSHFRFLHSPKGSLQYRPIKCVKIINACLLLHNRCIKRGIPVPADIYHPLRMKRCSMLMPTLLCYGGVNVLQAELCSKNSHKTSSSNEIVEVPGTCLVQPLPVPAAPSPARPCSDESAAGFPALETELLTLCGHLQYSLEENMTLHHVTK
ncbi:uncharacterized protein LOC135113224 isoform X2 [Scylla paramamosain]